MDVNCSAIDDCKNLEGIYIQNKEYKGLIILAPKVVAQIVYALGIMLCPRVVGNQRFWRVEKL